LAISRGYGDFANTDATVAEEMAAGCVLKIVLLKGVHWLGGF